VDVRRLARQERADLAAFLATLSPQQWQAPTLCASWRVRDVVAHVISYGDLPTRGLLAYLIPRGGQPPDRLRPHYHPAALEACIATCKSCGDECARHAPYYEHCRVCEQACRRCEQACRELLGVLK
jgi:uncharacterized protein (TIGR03083 family)